jgi:predicted nucleotidyltransferase component of viral defense system
MTINKIVHENILVSVLKGIFLDHAIQPILGFKGGTAAKLFYDLDRFSVDLDFDLLDISKKDYVFEHVKKVLEKFGDLKEAKEKRFTLYFSLNYTDRKISAQKLKVEINIRHFDSKYEGMTYMGIPMNVMVKEDMVANKLVAMYERIEKTSRDIYDVRFFLQKMWPINEEIIKNRTGLSFEDFVIKSIEKLELLKEDKILTGLGELLTENQKDSARAKMKIETLFYLKLLLKNIQEGNFK